MENLVYKKIDKIEYDIVIADETLKSIYSDKFQEDSLFVKAGEGAKNFEFLEKIIKYMQNKCIDRSSKIAVVGGGSLSDVVGFAAGIYMRGVKHDIIPTTLLSIVDACVGGKTAINFESTKNFVGIFNEAENVIIDTNFTKTETIDNLKNGVVEALKTSALFDKDIFYKMCDLIDFDMTRRDEFVEIVSLYCPKKKQEIVAADFRDRGLRQLLNAGHTIAHAIESYENYKISHGKAVAIGLIIEHKFLNRDTANIFLDIFTKLYGNGLEDAVRKYRDVNLNIAGDKKSSGDYINIPLIETIGNSRIIKLSKSKFLRGISIG